MDSLNPFIEQRTKGLEVITAVLADQQRVEIIKTHPFRDKDAEGYDPRIGKQMSRDVRVRKGPLEFLVSLSTQPYPIVEFVQKLIAAQNMGIYLVPVVRKSVEYGQANPDGEFFLRPGDRRSFIGLGSRRTANVIGAKRTERTLALAATLNCIPYLQPNVPDNGRVIHPDSIRLYNLRKVQLDHGYTGQPFAWRRGKHKSVVYQEALLQNPTDAQQFTVMPVVMTQQDLELVKGAYTQALAFVEESGGGNFSDLAAELNGIEALSTGILVPTKYSSECGFPLLGLMLRYAVVCGRDQVGLTRAMEERRQRIDSDSPFREYEHAQYEHQMTAIDQLRTPK